MTPDDSGAAADLSRASLERALIDLRDRADKSNGLPIYPEWVVELSVKLTGMPPFGPGFVTVETWEKFYAEGKDEPK
jgi:hypothetical protein